MRKKDASFFFYFVEDGKSRGGTLRQHGSHYCQCSVVIPRQLMNWISLEFHFPELISI